MVASIQQTSVNVPNLTSQKKAANNPVQSKRQNMPLSAASCAVMVGAPAVVGSILLAILLKKGRLKTK